METMTSSSGTPAYMAPEVLLQKPDDGRSDIFSLGLVFYEMLGGEQPFHTDSLATTVARIVHVDPPPLKNVSGPLPGVIARMLVKNPAERYPNAATVLADLRRIQAGGRPKFSASASGQLHQYRIFAALAPGAAVISFVYGGRLRFSCPACRAAADQNSCRASLQRRRQLGSETGRARGRPGGKRGRQARQSDGRPRL
jgi:hypothetical protein